jgi:molybdopterin-containing oxidoreductase family iron-sulfur binding subunit
VHAAAHAINQALGNQGISVTYADAGYANPVDPMRSLQQLTRDMQIGQVETLIILGPNPVYEAPASLNFADALGRVKLRLHLGSYYDETAELCHWHIPESHYLEAWSDSRAFDGTVTISQPLLAPLYGSKSIHEVLSVLTGFPDRSSHDVVKDYWRTVQPRQDFDDFWRTSLHDGVVAGTALPGKTMAAPKPVTSVPAAASAGLEVVFRPDPSIFDGMSSNNGWLQELPKPQNKMTWENAVWISPATAQRLGLNTGDVVEVQIQDRRVNGPVWILPGHANESLTLHLGYGRRRAGHVGNGIGFDANLLRRADAPWSDLGANVRRLTGKHEFASTQHTQTMEGRSPFRVATLEEFHREPSFAHPEEETVPDGMSLFPQYPYRGDKWGMAIDLNACIGCNACAVACQAENNIPVVGRIETAKGRHMNWLRVDRYYRGSLDDPELYFQPVPCMQCENAPCELVCPVGATVHSGDGLNQMIYNRCVGTRYCSNNCPYKVRRFNFYLYSDWYTKSLYGVRNPDVSVRSRGVMEKCTYCIQRINRVKIEAEKEERAVRDGDILTACQQACPTQAIVFGNLNDPNSRVSRLKAEPRNYSLLEELNTRPRTTYLARIRNPNPALEKG